ncbi:MAG: hypothetical protein K9M57_01375 [Phycisphaerae bacterium]|nr:hypothetical protein [Phycisphaerae bacterium]
MLVKFALFLIITVPVYAQTVPSGTAPPQIPPEVLQRLMKNVPIDEVPAGQLPLLSNHRRLAMVAVALSVLIIGLLICNLLHGHKKIEEITSVYFLFGVFGGLSGLCFATACTGSLFLHLAAVVCTFVSGFSVSAFLLPQLQFIRTWLIGPEISYDKKDCSIQKD